jgi:hypothetical protein
MASPAYPWLKISRMLWSVSMDNFLILPLLSVIHPLRLPLHLLFFLFLNFQVFPCNLTHGQEWMRLGKCPWNPHGCCEA